MTTAKSAANLKYLVIITLAISLPLLVLTPARALNIAGSKHDLTQGVYAIPGLTDICRACHGGAHNWLPGAGGFGRTPQLVTKVYDSATMDHNIDLAYINTMPSDAPLCLSCHDGSLAYAYLAPLDGTSADIGSDLSNDHPVGFHFDAALDSEIKNPTTARVNFGASNDGMWCSTCHEVHDNTNPPFLVMSNSGSALCKDCHTK